MSTSDSRLPTPDSPRADFAPTRWSVVLAASAQNPEAGSDSQAQRALADLCGAYWYPLYAYVRRSGVAPEDACDLTQAFFTRLLESNFLDQADPKRGRFRTFLLTALKHFLINEWARERTQKRGGGRVLVSIDVHDAEQRYRIEPVDDQSPEKLFDRQWALSVLNRALERLRQEHADAGKTELFEALKEVLYGHASADHAAIGERLGMTTNAVGVAFHRLRRRYRDILRQQIAETVAASSDINEEINDLLACL